MAVNPMHKRLAAIAVKQIAKNGRALTLRRYKETGPEWDPTLTPVDVQVTGVQTKNNKDDISAGLIKQNDLTYLLDADVDPRDYEFIVDSDGVERKINPLDTVFPGEIGIIYKVGVTI